MPKILDKKDSGQKKPKGKPKHDFIEKRKKPLDFNKRPKTE